MSVEENKSEHKSEHDKENKIIEQYHIVNGLLEGEYQNFTDSRELQSFLMFVGGKLNGICRFYSEGQLIQMVKFKDNNLNGRALTYQDGVITTCSSYKDGKLNGVMTHYYDNKKIKALMHYQYGKQHGEAYYYDKLGNKMSEASYKDGKLHGISILYYPDGKIVKKEEYDMGKLIKDGVNND